MYFIIFNKLLTKFLPLPIQYFYIRILNSCTATKTAL